MAIKAETKEPANKRSNMRIPTKVCACDLFMFTFI
jgi:hypothetical protein